MSSNMQKIFLILFIAMGLSISTASIAQDTATETAEEPKVEATTEEPAPETETAETTSSEDQTFPVAEETTEQIGSEYIRGTHGDWQIICIRTGKEKPDNCRMYQLLNDETDNAVAELSILALENASQAAAGVNFITPLGTLLTAQASMRVDSGKVKRYPYSWCEKLGCITRFGLTNAELNSLKKGNKAVMSITAAAAPKAPLSLDVSLSGFTAAWNALNAK
jgi:invasion protein IalB